MCARARPRRVRRGGGPGPQLGPVGPRRRDRHAQPGRRRGPAPRRRLGRVGTGLRPRAAPVGGRGDPARLRRGPGQPDPHHDPGQPAARAPTPTGSAPARTCSPWPPRAPPTGTPWPTAATAGCIYNGYPASSGHRRRRRPLRHPPPRHRASAGASCSTWPAPSGARCSSRATPSRPADLDAACDLARVAVEPGDIVLVRTGQMVHLAPERRDLVAYTWPVARADHRDGRVVPRPRRGGGGHRHARLRGLPLPVRGPVPAGARAAPGRDGPDPGPELGARRAGGRLRRGRPLHFLLDATPLPLTDGLGSPLNPVALR